MELARVVADAILDASADAVVATDHKGIIRVWNPGAERIFGHSAEEAIGQSLDLIIPERLRARHREGFDQVMANGRSRYGEGDLLSVPAIRKGGERISVEFTVVQGEGAVYGALRKEMVRCGGAVVVVVVVQFGVVAADGLGDTVVPG